MKIINSNNLKILKGIKALIFDWDGVFHSGYKNEKGESTFSEADSMGVNMLRLSYYLQNGEIPYTAIVTGENNPTGQFLAKREHFDNIFIKIKDKKIIADYLNQNHNIKNEEILFVFDDILDLSLAKIVGTRFLVNRNASHELQQFILEKSLCDYITSNDGSNHAIREICEFTLKQKGSFNTTIETRIEHGETYKNYLLKRQQITTQLMTIKSGELSNL